MGDGLRRHGDGAVRAQHRPRRRLGRLPRLARPGPGAEAGAGRREARGARARPEHHARLLRRRRADERRRSTRRASTGSATRCGSWIPDDPAKGLVFDGRLAEDFKLSTRHLGQRRPAARADPGARGRLRAGRRDRRATIGRSCRRSCSRTCSLCRGLCPELGADAPARTLVDDPRVRARFPAILDALARESTGSSTFVARAMLLDQPPSIDAARDHRQGLAQPEDGAPEPRRARRGALRRARRRLT